MYIFMHKLHPTQQMLDRDETQRLEFAFCFFKWLMICCDCEIFHGEMRHILTWMGQLMLKIVTLGSKKNLFMCNVICVPFLKLTVWCGFNATVIFSSFSFVEITTDILEVILKICGCMTVVTLSAFTASSSTRLTTAHFVTFS